MAEVLLPIRPGTLPPGYCFSTWQQLLVDLSGAQNAVLPGDGFFINSETKPDPSLNSFLWYIPSQGRWYNYSGDWISPNPETSLDVRRIFVGDATALQTYDGGDSGTPGPSSGPMWEIDTDFAGRSPMGAGTIPNFNPNKVLALDEDFGDGTHQQTVAEMPAHKHTPEPAESDGFFGHAAAGSAATYNVLGGGDTIQMVDTAATGGSGDMNMVHPVRGVYIIKRSSVRTHYKIP